MTKINNAKNMSIITFSRTFKNFLSFIPCLINPTPKIPPAKAVMKYAAISGKPCIAYLAIPNGISLKLYFVNMPIAAAITLAFQTKINNAPAPNIRENIKVNIITYTLFSIIDKNLIPLIEAPVKLIFQKNIVQHNPLHPLGCLFDNKFVFENSKDWHLARLYSRMKMLQQNQKITT